MKPLILARNKKTGGLSCSTKEELENEKKTKKNGWFQLKLFDKVIEMWVQKVDHVKQIYKFLETT